MPDFDPGLSLCSTVFNQRRELALEGLQSS